MRQTRCDLPCQQRQRRLYAQFLSIARAAAFQFDLTVLQAARPGDELPGQTNQVHICELCACPLLAIIVKDFNAGIAKFRVQFIASRVARLVPSSQINEPNLEGRYRIRPDDTLVVVARFNNCTNQT